MVPPRSNKSQSDPEHLHLPVRAVIDDLRAALCEHGAAVLEVPPGAGKSTIVPLELLEEPWLAADAKTKRAPRKILMLEPRRLAARAVAERMAELRGDAIGQSVGYRVRFESAVSSATRIEVVTEGILTRRIQNDPELSDVGLVIFDEFHERSLHGDLALALVLEARAAFREDLRVLVMSATLGGTAERVAELLARDSGDSDVPVIRSQGRAFPVEIRQLADSAIPESRLYPAAIASATVPVIQQALQTEAEGDVLVFLPGAGEIRRLAAMLGELARSDANLHESTASVLPLYGDLNRKAQQAALRRDPRGRRKVILATPIAETSLTIPGVCVVVDSGLCRAPRYAANTGLSRLALTRISRAAADQRAGRAGRTGPGMALRLWSQHDHDRLEPELRPEVLDADLAALLLELAAWGVPLRENATLPLALLDAPPPAHVQRALRLLWDLGALKKSEADGALRVTEAGRAMIRLPVHPRLGAMLVAAAKAPNTARLATRLAALLSERDFMRESSGLSQRSESSGVPARSILTRLELLETYANGKTTGYPASVDLAALRRISDVAAQLSRLLPSNTRDERSPRGEAWIAGLLAHAFPDRVGRLRVAQGERQSVTPSATATESSYLLTAGQSAVLPAPPPGVRLPESLIALELQPPGDGRGEDRIRLYAPVGDAAALAALCAAEPLAQQTVRAAAYRWDRVGEKVQAALETRCGALVLRAKELQASTAGEEAEVLDPDEVRNAFLDGARDLLKRRGPTAFAANDEDAKACRELQSRLEFVRGQIAELDTDLAIPGLDEMADRGLPDWSDEGLSAAPLVWLGDALYGYQSLAAFRKEQRLTDVLLGRLPYATQCWLNESVPTHLEVPSGSRIRLQYSASEAVLPVKLQELFGLRETPRVLGGRVPVTLHLLSPARRPIQVTRDLSSFWANTYAEVRKELKGRYPKHPWPEDPFDPVQAVATRHVKKRMREN